jgi:hypothetical protein
MGQQQFSHLRYYFLSRQCQYFVLPEFLKFQALLFLQNNLAGVISLLFWPVLLRVASSTTNA